jgi:hydroxymethylbilane synthase
VTEHRVIVATRRSALALAQARAFMAVLRATHPGLEVEELQVVTTGDKVQDRLLREIGGKGLFVKEIEEALLDGRADLAVHSLKDVPPELPPGLVIGAHPRREDPRDVLISRAGQKLDDLPRGARVGTASLRRSVQLSQLRPDLSVAALRGNVDTRLRKCREGEVDAIVLAHAGLIRLGLEGEATEVLDPDRMIPAGGQGALGIEHRAGDERVAALLFALADADTTTAVTVERAAMRALGGDCQLPVAAHAVRDGSEVWVRGFLAEPNGENPRRAELRAPFPPSLDVAERLGVELSRRLGPA